MPCLLLTGCFGFKFQIAGPPSNGTAFICLKETIADSLDTVAEWLRRVIRNHLGLSRVGSSPTSVESLKIDIHIMISVFICPLFGKCRVSFNLV